MTASQYPVRKFLSLSTIHIPQSDTVLLDQAARRDGPAVLGVAKYPEGYWISLGGLAKTESETDRENERHALVAAGISSALMHLMQIGASRGCDYLQLDGDSEICDLLPKFDWDHQPKKPQWNPTSPSSGTSPPLETSTKTAPASAPSPSSAGN